LRLLHCTEVVKYDPMDLGKNKVDYWKLPGFVLNLPWDALAKLSSTLARNLWTPERIFEAHFLGCFLLEETHKSLAAKQLVSIGIPWVVALSLLDAGIGGR